MPIDNPVDLVNTRYSHEPPATAITQRITVSSIAGDKALGTIAVAGIPAGATVTEAYLDFGFRTVKNIYAGVNKLNANQNIEIQKGAGAFATAIVLPDDAFTIDANTKEVGTFFRGTVNISATITEDDTYTIKWTNADADQDSLEFDECQASLRISYSV
ncbi:unnamed protein product [marine sediment metagenome]|uniref:Uncharacterized protein n=1 Tax=marine sediment metagenome TaxID=412755 RepID=X1G154_9ZZZZ